ncbi:hypothetical protein [Nostoc sp.]|uniref:hypothetical protein n=1 Tax=Nostoc sp. TaxID=1180 RepID=UPI002FFB707F
MWRFRAIKILIFVLVIVVAVLIYYNFNLVKHIEGVIQPFLNLEGGKQTELIFTFISNLIGTAIGALFAFLIALRQLKYQSSLEAKKKRVDITFDLYQEFSTNEMAEARSQADKIFTAHKTASNIDDFYRNLPEVEKYPIRHVLYFYQRLQLAIEHDRVEASVALDLFSEEFIWWYHVWYVPMLIPSTWDQSIIRMNKLHEWMEKQSKKDSQSQTAYEKWKSQAYRSRTKRLP